MDEIVWESQQAVGVVMIVFIKGGTLQGPCEWVDLGMSNKCRFVVSSVETCLVILPAMHCSGTVYFLGQYVNSQLGSSRNNWLFLGWESDCLEVLWCLWVNHSKCCHLIILFILNNEKITQKVTAWRAFSWKVQPSGHLRDVLNLFQWKMKLSLRLLTLQFIKFKYPCNDSKSSKLCTTHFHLVVEKTLCLWQLTSIAKGILPCKLN